MNCTRLLLTQFRINEATKMFKTDLNLRNYDCNGFKAHLKTVKLNRENYKDFTPVFGLNKSKTSMFIGSSLFFAVFVIINALIFVYYCYRIRKIKRQDNDYSFQSFHTD